MKGGRACGGQTSKLSDTTHAAVPTNTAKGTTVTIYAHCLPENI